MRKAQNNQRVIIDKGFYLGYNNTVVKKYRSVAQFGRALRSGRRGRGFESRRFDSLAGAPEALFIRFSVLFMLYFILTHFSYNFNLINTDLNYSNSQYSSFLLCPNLSSGERDPIYEYIRKFYDYHYRSNFIISILSLMHKK